MIRTLVNIKRQHVCVCIYIYIYIYIYTHMCIYIYSNLTKYTRSPLQDSRLVGPRPWKVLAATYEQMGS